jgi:O-antigen ligase
VLLHFLHLPVASFFSSNGLLVAAAVIVSAIYALVFGSVGLEKHVLSLLIGLPFFLVFVFNSDIISVVCILLLFAKLDVFVYKVVVLSSIPLAFSFVMAYRSGSLQKVKVPIYGPLLIYLVCIVPSFWNSHSLYTSTLNLLNFASMILMFTVLGNHVTKYKQVTWLSVAFVAASLLNGSNVIVDGLLTRQRVFGFAGVVYVDFVCIAIIVTTIAAFYQTNARRVWLVLISIFLFASLLFTQTRNVFIPLTSSLVFLLSYLFFDNAAFSINRRKMLLSLFTLSTGIVVAIIVLSLIVPGIFERFADFFSKKQHISTDDPLVSNTLISRLLIWHTAFKAFLQHPFVGIGAYSFCFDSQYYRTIPIFLYKNWVQGLSPHVAYLAVLTETGILGFAGFTIFLISTLRMGHRSLRVSHSRLEKFFSLGILSLQVYVCFSMAVTDAWLWGQCGMLWSIILGISIANYKIIMRSQSPRG